METINFSKSKNIYDMPQTNMIGKLLKFNLKIQKKTTKNSSKTPRISKEINGISSIKQKSFELSDTSKQSISDLKEDIKQGVVEALNHTSGHAIINGHDIFYQTKVSEKKKENDELEIVLKISEENTKTLYEKRKIISFTVNHNLITELAFLVLKLSKMGYNLNRSDLVNLAISNFIKQTINKPIQSFLNEIKK